MNQFSQEPLSGWTGLDEPLPGEDVDSQRADDARHWLEVYSELLDFKHAVLRETERRIGPMLGAARDEIERTDKPLLRAEAERFQHRQRFWQERLAELTARL